MSCLCSVLHDQGPHRSDTSGPDVNQVIPVQEGVSKTTASLALAREGTDRQSLSSCLQADSGENKAADEKVEADEGDEVSDFIVLKKSDPQEPQWDKDQTDVKKNNVGIGKLFILYNCRPLYDAHSQRLKRLKTRSRDTNT